MNYCSSCGSGLLNRHIPAGDTRERTVCSLCGMIHYENPRLVVGCMPLWEGKVLLGRRAIGPRQGLWNLPAGFMETGETIEEAAIRETREEMNATVTGLKLHCVYSIVHVHQVYVIFKCVIKDGIFSIGAETSEVALFGIDEIPWESIAFSSNKFALERWIANPEYEGVHIGASA